MYPQSIREHGFLAQLVQSIWFTPRGSGVRIPQDPQNQEENQSKLLKAFFSGVFLFPDLPKIQQNRAVKTGEIGGLYLLKVLYKISIEFLPHNVMVPNQIL